MCGLATVGYFVGGVIVGFLGVIAWILSGE